MYGYLYLLMLTHQLTGNATLLDEAIAVHRTPGALHRGEFFNMFSQVATDDLDYARELGILWWDRPALSVQVVSIVFKTVFFVMTVVILMNLLIAMMTNTFKEVFIIADQEWRLVYAQKVKEFYESTVTPPPFNTIEDLLNTLMRSTVARNIR